MSWVIRFDFPEQDEPVYAGWFKDSIGYAPTLKTAATFETREGAEATLANAYGPETASYGQVEPCES